MLKKLNKWRINSIPWTSNVLFFISILRTNLGLKCVQVKIPVARLSVFQFYGHCKYSFSWHCWKSADFVGYQELMSHPSHHCEGALPEPHHTRPPASTIYRRLCRPQAKYHVFRGGGAAQWKNQVKFVCTSENKFSGCRNHEIDQQRKRSSSGLI